VLKCRDKPGIRAHACNSIPQGAAAGRSWVLGQGQPSYRMRPRRSKEEEREDWFKKFLKCKKLLQCYEIMDNYINSRPLYFYYVQLSWIIFIFKNTLSCL
jgi:hypothetical protein